MGRKEQQDSYGIGSRLMYGMGEFLGGGCFVIINTFFTVLLTKALGMPAAMAGTIPLLGKIWEGIMNPIMGNITDRTRSRFGAKRFYILIGGITSSLMFIFMWITIPTHNMVVMYIFYLFMYCLFSTGFTIFLVPYNGLLPDMVEDYNMRSKFSSARMIWSTLGSATCGLVPAILITNNLNTASYSVCAYIFGFLFLVASMGTFIGTWERQREPVQTTLKESIPQSVSVFRNRSFRLFLGLHIFGQCAMDFVSGMAVYYIDDVLNGYVHGYLTYAMGTLLASQLIGMLVWGPIMTKTSKKAAILSGAPIRLMGTLGLLFVSYEGVPIGSTLIMFGLIGFGNAATLTGIYAIMADMADVDELITSVHRPGTVSGMATFVRKTSAGISAAMMGLLLSVVGYDEVVANAGGRQAAFTQQGISMIFILVPALLITCLIVTAVIFPITADEFAIIKKEVARRKGEDDSRATEEEIRVCEKVTGFSFEDLWKAENMTGRS